MLEHSHAILVVIHITSKYSPAYRCCPFLYICQLVPTLAGRLYEMVLAFADNTAVFRDIKALGYRKVLQDADGLKVIEVICKV